MKKFSLKNVKKESVMENLPFAVSFVFFCLTISEANLKSLVISCSIGLILGLGCVLLDAKKNVISKLQPIEKKICFGISVIFSILISFIFYSVWEPSSTIKSILEMISKNTEFLLRIGSILFSLLGCAAIFLIVSIFAIPILKIIHQIDFKLLWKFLVSNISLKPILCSFANIIVMALVGTILLFSVYSIPTLKIENNVEKSAVLIQDEGTYPSIVKWCNSQLDNFTDAIMLLEAANKNDKSTIEQAMQANRGVIDDLNPYEVLIAHYTKGTSFSNIGSYARYWHGYHVFVKPLLLVMNYVEIRIINGILQFLLFFIICFLFYKKGKAKYILPFLITYLMLMPVALGESLQFSSCYYIFSIGTVVILLLNDIQREKYYWVVFLNIGVAVAFFDFLTYPIATFGIPAIIYFLLEKVDSIEQQLCKLIKSGIAWCFGYIGMWSMKWIIASIVTGTNVLANAFSAIKGRTSHSSADGKVYYSAISCILKNVKAFNYTPFIICLIILVIIMIYKMNQYGVSLGAIGSKNKITLWFLIGILPFLWYLFTTNHSSIHYWFTNKALSVSVLGVGFICIHIIEFCQNKNQAISDSESNKRDNNHF